MRDSHLCGSGRCGFRAGELDISPVRGIGIRQHSAHVLVSILTAKSIHISGFTVAFIDDDSRA